MPIGTSETHVSAALDLGPGSYVLSAKLYAAHTGGPGSSALTVTCMFDGEDLEDADDSTTITLQPGGFNALSLASTTKVEDSASVFVACSAGEDEATALRVQLIAIRVDSVQVIR